MPEKLLGFSNCEKLAIVFQCSVSVKIYKQFCPVPHDTDRRGWKSSKRGLIEEIKLF